MVTESVRESPSLMLEWGPWQAWTLNSAGEKRRLRYQVPRKVSQETSTAPTILDPNIPFEPKKGERRGSETHLLIFTMFRPEMFWEELQWKEMLYPRAAV